MYRMIQIKLLLINTDISNTNIKGKFRVHELYTDINIYIYYVGYLFFLQIFHKNLYYTFYQQNNRNLFSFYINAYAVYTISI